MKKVVVWGALASAALLLAGCGSQQSSSKSSSSSVKTEKKATKASSSSKQSSKTSSTKQTSATESEYTTSEYALMGFLKLDGQGADHLLGLVDNAHWAKRGNIYAIDFGAHSTEMTVKKNEVLVRYDSSLPGGGMGTKNASKTYSKQELENEFGNDKATIDQFLAQVGDGSASSSQSTSQVTPQEVGIMLYQMKQPEALKTYLGERLWYRSADKNTDGEVAGYNSITPNGDGQLDIYWKQSGDQITYKYLVAPADGPASDAKTVTETISLSDLESKYYATKSQQDTVKNQADQLMVGNEY